MLLGAAGGCWGPLWEISRALAGLLYCTAMRQRQRQGRDGPGSEQAGAGGRRPNSRGSKRRPEGRLERWWGGPRVGWVQYSWLVGRGGNVEDGKGDKELRRAAR